MSNVVLDLVQSAMGGVASGVGAAINAGAKTAIDAVKENKEALTLFEKNGKKGDGANFGIASCAVDKEGDVYRVLGGISYYASAGNTKIAFFEQTSSSAKVFSPTASGAKRKSACCFDWPGMTPQEQAAMAPGNL